MPSDTPTTPTGPPDSRPSSQPPVQAPTDPPDSRHSAQPSVAPTDPDTPTTPTDPPDSRHSAQPPVAPTDPDIPTTPTGPPGSRHSAQPPFPAPTDPPDSRHSVQPPIPDPTTPTDPPDSKPLTQLKKRLWKLSKFKRTTNQKTKRKKNWVRKQNKYLPSPRGPIPEWVKQG